MARKPETQHERYARCSTEGSIIPVAEVDLGQIQTMLTLSLQDWQAVRGWAVKSAKNGPEWNAIFKLHYDVLHQLAEALCLFDGIKVNTHECLFAYICEKHQELDFAWNFLEDVRRKRNRSIYYGEPATYQDWKRTELQLNLYINVLKKTIEKKLKT
ncbi:MAG: hypothetical protein HY363_02070 [Candidatus Aenigmarchaeota archaeon]|nr:hypothetical protein [Candidatus Aenigmarchaeota archaeon]